MRLRDFIERAAQEADVSFHEPLNVDVRDSYAELISYNRDLFHRIPIVAIETEVPFFYSNAWSMWNAIEANTYHVWNIDTFPPRHPYASHETLGIFRFGKWIFPKHFITSRIVHDYFGHYKNRIGFGTMNELKLAALVYEELPENARMAHMCEFVTQICYFEVYGEYPEQKAFRVSDGLMEHWKAIRKELL